MPQDGRLAGRRVIATGAASGIGRAAARLFAAEGAQLALLDRNAEGLAEIAAETGALAIPCDVTDEAAVRAAVAQAAEALGGLDGVCNVAGGAIPARLADTTLSDWNAVLTLNLTGPMLICREALAHLEQAARPSIVNVSSGSALLPVGMALGSYVASKAGLIALSKALASELSPKVRVNVVCPGAVDTPILPDVLRGPANDPERSPYALRRVADPEEIAAALLFLLSDEASYVTGATLAVDGGRTFH